MTGETKEFRELEFAALRTQLMRIALRCGVASADGEDLVQDAMLRALEKAPPPADARRWCAWLATVLRRLGTDLTRRRQRARVDHECDPDSLFAADDQTLSSPEYTLSQITMASLACSEKLRDVYQLCDVRGLSAHVVAQQLGVSVQVVTTRLCRARAKVRAVLEQDLNGRVACVTQAVDRDVREGNGRVY
jgi:RNA polymerase sigma-70 factor, ECF subfamily